MDEEIEQFKRLLRSADDLLQQISGLWHEEPKVSVQDQGNRVKITIAQPGGSARDNRDQWAFRVMDHYLQLRRRHDYENSVRNDLRGYFSERGSKQYTKIIQLPARVKQRPSDVQYGEGGLTILFDKLPGFPDEGWHALDTPSRR